MSAFEGRSRHFVSRDERANYEYTAWSLGRLRHLRAHDGAKVVDAGETLRRLDVPKGPAVAGFEPLRQRADAVDRADCVAKGNCAVGAHQRAMAALGVGEFYAR